MSQQTEVKSCNHRPEEEQGYLSTWVELWRNWRGTGEFDRASGERGAMVLEETSEDDRV